MDMTGEYHVPAPRQKVYDALNNVEILKQCIPGCETIEMQSDTQMTATVRAKVGPVSARFGGKVTISDRDPPNGYKISGEGAGGPAGFAKGGATVTLTDDGAGTKLSYKVEANVGGKLAQIGSRLIDATARQMAEAFFAKFTAVVGAASAADDAAAAPAPVTPIATTPDGATPAAADAPYVAQMPPPPSATVQTPTPAVQPTPVPAAAPSGRLSPMVWVAILAVVVAGLLYYFTR